MCEGVGAGRGDSTAAVDALAGAGKQMAGETPGCSSAGTPQAGRAGLEVLTQLGAREGRC